MFKELLQVMLVQLPESGELLMRYFLLVRCPSCYPTWHPQCLGMKSCARMLTVKSVVIAVSFVMYDDISHTTFFALS